MIVPLRAKWDLDIDDPVEKDRANRWVVRCNRLHDAIARWSCARPDTYDAPGEPWDGDFIDYGLMTNMLSNQGQERLKELGDPDNLTDADFDGVVQHCLNKNKEA